MLSVVQRTPVYAMTMSVMQAMTYPTEPSRPVRQPGDGREDMSLIIVVVDEFFSEGYLTKEKKYPLLPL